MDDPRMVESDAGGPVEAVLVHHRRTLKISPQRTMP